MFLKVEQEHMIIEDTKIDNIRKIIFCQILGYQATLTTFLLNQAELDLFSSPNFFPVMIMLSLRMPFGPCL